MLNPLPTPGEMAAWDAEAIGEFGIPGSVLMENAAREAMRVLECQAGPLDDKTVYLFAGSGNNGGDAFAMARYLMDRAATVAVFHTRPKKQYRGETRANLVLARKLGVPLFHIATANLGSLPQPDILVDGLLGTGFKGTLRKDTLRLVRHVNRLGERAYVLSIDIPSGLNGHTGRPGPEAVRADATVTFQAAKTGLVMPGAEQWTGALFVRDIGIPRAVQDAKPVRRFVVGSQIMRTIPEPEADAHKGSAGHVLVIGGSPGLTGAPHLAALGALRAGAGLVTVACPESLCAEVKGGRPEIMTMPLVDSSQWDEKTAKNVVSKLSRFDAVTLGPGLGTGGKTVDFLREIIARCPVPLVLDADALNALSQAPELFGELSPRTVLTPHPGEMGRLTGSSSAEVQRDRLSAAEGFIEKTQAVLVLKGAGTIIADRKQTRLCPLSAPCLAVGGAGDVLSGAIASLAASGMKAMDAATLGVYWHAVAGAMLENEYPRRGNLAGEIAHMLPRAAKEYTTC